MNIEWPVILASLLLGLAGAPHCFGMCGGIACAAGSLPGGRLAIVTANLYRLVTYGCLGALAGALLQPLAGLTVLDPYLRAAMGVAMLVAGMVILRGRGGPGARLGFPLLRRAAAKLQRAGNGSSVLFGIGWGLLPCGMVYGALLMNAAGGAPTSSALGMLAFGLGTLPAVGGAGLALRWFAVRPSLRPIYGTLVLLLGAGTLTHALTTFPGAGDTPAGLHDHGGQHHHGLHDHATQAAHALPGGVDSGQRQTRLDALQNQTNSLRSQDSGAGAHCPPEIAADATEPTRRLT